MILQLFTAVAIVYSVAMYVVELASVTLYNPNPNGHPEKSNSLLYLMVHN